MEFDLENEVDAHCYECARRGADLRDAISDILELLQRLSKNDASDDATSIKEQVLQLLQENGVADLV